MRYKLLGKTGLRVSELCLGTMTFGEDWGWGASRDVCQVIFDKYCQAGGNFIDTACNYTNGSAERITGELVAGQRDYFVVATKYTLRRPGSATNDLNGGGNHRKNMLRSVEESLRRLNTDYIDLLYLHFWDFSTPVEEVLRGLDDLIRSGKVLYAGISDTPAWIASYAQAVAELRGWSRLAAYQGEYSLAERGIETDVLPMAKALELAVPAFGMLGGGALTGKFNQPGGPGEPTRARDASEKEKRLAQAIMEVAAELERTPSQVAINWVRQQGPQIIPILGARRENQIVDNLGVLEFNLSPEQLKRLAGANPQETLYPHTFWNEYVRRDLIYGERADEIDGLRR